MTQHRDWRIDLIEAHPSLFHPPEGHPEQASGYPWCEAGWRDLLERKCGRIEAALRDRETIRFSQIKKKFAGPRVYWRDDLSPETAAQINETIALAQARAACTCEECGAVGQLYQHAGRYQTLCLPHAKGTLIPAESGREDVQLARVVTARGFGIGPRRYDREADRFIDLPPGEEQ